MFGIGSQELLIVFLVVLLLFGADRIPELARAMGKSIRDFKRAAGEIESEIQDVARQKDLLSLKDTPRERPRAPEVKAGPTEKKGADGSGQAKAGS